MFARDSLFCLFVSGKDKELASAGKIIKKLFSSSLVKMHVKLECFSLESNYSPVWYLEEE